MAKLKWPKLKLAKACYRCQLQGDQKVRADLCSVSSVGKMWPQPGKFPAFGTRGPLPTAWDVSKGQKCWRPEIMYSASKTRELKSKSIHIQSHAYKTGHFVNLSVAIRFNGYSVTYNIIKSIMHSLQIFKFKHLMWEQFTTLELRYEMGRVKSYTLRASYKDTPKRRNKAGYIFFSGLKGCTC